MAGDFKSCCVDDCNANSSRAANGRNGYCARHYANILKYGDVNRVWVQNKPLAWLRQTVSTTERGCIPWPFAVDPSTGYGRVSIPLSDGGSKPGRAHRFMCELSKGPAPSTKHQSAHSCGNRICVNPRHLSWKTQRENEDDKLVHGTATRGERSSSAKLTVADVIEIRLAKGVTQKELAERFGVSRGHIAGLRKGKFWPELNPST